jgi:hypothetical protein
MDRIIAAKENNAVRWVLEQCTSGGLILWTFFKNPDPYGNIGSRDYGIPLPDAQREKVIRENELTPIDS